MTAARQRLKASTPPSSTTRPTRSTPPGASTRPAPRAELLADLEGEAMAADCPQLALRALYLRHDDGRDLSTSRVNHGAVIALLIDRMQTVAARLFSEGTPAETATEAREIARLASLAGRLASSLKTLATPS